MVILERLSNNQPLLEVNNLYPAPKELQAASEQSSSPQANLYQQAVNRNWCKESLLLSVLISKLLSKQLLLTSNNHLLPHQASAPVASNHLLQSLPSNHLELEVSNHQVFQHKLFLLNKLPLPKFRRSSSESSKSLHPLSRRR